MMLGARMRLLEPWLKTTVPDSKSREVALPQDKGGCGRPGTRGNGVPTPS